VEEGKQEELEETMLSTPVFLPLLALKQKKQMEMRKTSLFLKIKNNHNLPHVI
jgi:hypothetical protein